MKIGHRKYLLQSVVCSTIYTFLCVLPTLTTIDSIAKQRKIAIEEYLEKEKCMIGLRYSWRKMEGACCGAMVNYQDVRPSAE